MRIFSFGWIILFSCSLVSNGNKDASKIPVRCVASYYLLDSTLNSDFLVNKILTDSSHLSKLYELVNQGLLVSSSEKSFKFKLSIYWDFEFEDGTIEHYHILYRTEKGTVAAKHTGKVFKIFEKSVRAVKLENYLDSILNYKGK